VMPTSKVINRLIFMSSRSIAPCLAAIARSQDFAVLLKSRCGLPPSRQRIECVKRRLESQATRAHEHAQQRHKLVVALSLNQESILITRAESGRAAWRSQQLLFD
jgi:hypothetical protein